MSTALANAQHDPSGPSLLAAPTGNKDADSRARLFCRWLIETGDSWAAPDLVPFDLAQLGHPTRG